MKRGPGNSWSMHWNPCKDYDKHIYLDNKSSYFYDLELEHFLEDLTFYIQHIPEDARHILELGCGTGRLALSLAKAGYCVTGIDISPCMLQRAMKKYRSSAGQIHIHFICMDITQMAFRRCFDAILLPYNTLNMLINMSNLKQCLNLSRQYLRRDGRLLMDVFTPDRQLINLHGKRLVQFNSLPCPDGTTIRKEVSRGYHDKTYLLNITEIYRVYKDPTKLPTETYHYNYQLIALSEEQWEKVLTDCGFMIDAMYGDYALNPYFPSESTKILLTAIPKKAKF